MQILAMLTMLIDHIGYLFFPSDSTWRIIGRIAMPIYAYFLVLGFHRTSNMNRYIKRTAIIALLSQIPYMAAFQTYEINVVGTLFVCLLLLWLLDTLKGRPLLQGASIISAIALLEIVPCDYGSYALILVLIYRYAPVKTIMLAHLALNVLFIAAKGWYIQLFSLLSSFIMLYLPDFIAIVDRVRVPRWLWRSFYPLHLVILAITHYFMYGL